MSEEQRVRWERASGTDNPREVVVEFWHSPDYEPYEAVVDAQPDFVGLVLMVRPRAQSEKDGVTVIRLSMVRHVATVRLRGPLAGRPIRDVEPTGSNVRTVPARHVVDPDA